MFTSRFEWLRSHYYIFRQKSHFTKWSNTSYGVSELRNSIDLSLGYIYVVHAMITCRCSCVWTDSEQLLAKEKQLDSIPMWTNPRHPQCTKSSWLLQVWASTKISSVQGIHRPTLTNLNLDCLLWKPTTTTATQIHSLRAREPKWWTCTRKSWQNSFSHNRVQNISLEGLQIRMAFVRLGLLQVWTNPCQLFSLNINQCESARSASTAKESEKNKSDVAWFEVPG